MNPIIMAIIVVTIIGLIGAVILVAASIFMFVPVDERVEKITAVLAGANCGACGCAGCADYAKTIVEDGNAINKCTPGGAACVAAIPFTKGTGMTLFPEDREQRRKVNHDSRIQIGLSFLFFLCFWLLFFSQLFVRPPQTAILLLCISFSWGCS